MDSERWTDLMNDPEGCLSAKELAEGWHWCGDWDDLLVGPGMMELTCCTCENIPIKTKEEARTKYNDWLERQKPAGEF